MPYWIARIALVLAALGTPLSAETIGVRGGEHDGFTRLVFDFPYRMGWELEQDEVPVLKIAGRNITFDLGAAFQKITDQRVSALVPTGAGGIRLNLNCDCDIDAFWAGSTMLVLDLRDPEQMADVTARPKAREDAMTKQEEQPETQPHSQRVERSASVFPFKPAAPASGSAGLGLELDVGPVEAAASDNGERVPVSLERTSRLQETERQLLEQIGRAATQGLITARTPQRRQFAQNEEEPDDAAIGREYPTNSDETVLSSGLNLRAQSSADQAFLEANSAFRALEGEQVCFSDDQADVVGWGGKRSFGELVGEYRAKLFGEFDKPNPDAAMKLAQTYLHFGFGAEALSVLRVIEPHTETSAALMSMARIVEHGFDQQPSPFHRQLECEGRVALWAALAHETLPPSAVIDTDAILRTLSEFDPPMRSHLGPILANRMIASDRVDLASDIQRIVERGLDTGTPQSEMAGAELHLAKGELEPAAEALDEVVASNTELSPEALAKMVDARLGLGEAIDLETTQLVEAYALEYRESEIAADLQRVLILARASLGDFDRVFNELRKLSVTAPAAVPPLRNHAIHELAQVADDPSFFKHTLNQSAQVRNQLAPNVSNLVAERLLELGFYDEADTFLRQGADGVDGRQRRVLRARSALGQVKPRRAEADLLGLHGADVEILRAQALSLSGEHQAASTLYAEANQERKALDEAWLASDWSLLEQSSDPELAQLSRLLDSETDTAIAAIEGELARDQALLDDSIKSRTQLTRVLRKYEMNTALAENQ